MRDASGPGEGSGGQPVEDRTWVVDAFNVLGARPDGWWRNRMRALAELRDAIAAWCPPGDDMIVMVDGWPHREVPEGTAGTVEVRYARRGGPDGADRAIVDLVCEADDAARWTVVTSDAALRRRVTAAGATVVGAGRFRSALDGT